MLGVTIGLGAERGPYFTLAKITGAPPSTAFTTANLTYQGAFRAPSSVSLDFCQCGLYYDPAGNSGAGSLFIATANQNTPTTGVANWGGVAEFSIPTPLVSGTLAALPRATALQGDTDATEGILFMARNGVSDTASIDGLKVVGSTLYINAANGYDPGGSQNTSFFVRNRTLGMAGTLSGPFGPATGVARPTAGYLSDIPAAWQGRFGGDTFTGLWSENTIETISSGYAAFALNMASVTGVFNPIPLLFYPNAHPLGPTYGVIADGSTNAIWTPALSGGSSMVMPIGYDSAVFFGGKGTGGWCYGQGTPTMALDHMPTGQGDIYCYDPESNDKGGHGFPTKAYYWMYHASDLLNVKTGSVNSWDPVPYAYGTISSLVPTFDSLYGGKPGISGAAYDAVHNRIFLSAQKQDGAGAVIHVFGVTP